LQAKSKFDNYLQNGYKRGMPYGLLNILVLDKTRFLFMVFRLVKKLLKNMNMLKI